ncbi:MAG TPA: hypothetical protein VGL77_08365 [Armatimonadota bacterium]
MSVKPFPCRLRVQFSSYTDARLEQQQTVDIDAAIPTGVCAFNGARWRYALELVETSGRVGIADLTVTFTLQEGIATDTSLGVQYVFDKWSTENYVAMPAALYAGNRFDARRMPYPPLLDDPADIGVDVPTIITDVPRLNHTDGPSRVQLLTRDLATPAVGIHFPGARRGWWLLTDPSTILGVSGIAIAENDTRTQAIVSLTAPGMREDTCYHGGRMDAPSPDRGTTFYPDDTVTLRLRVYTFVCLDVPALYAKFLEIRQDLTGPATLRHSLPFSSAWAIQEEKYNAQNWEAERGYYSVGMRDSMYQDWQIGWVGGAMSTFPLLLDGEALSQERAQRTLDFAFTGQAASGFFHGVGHHGEWIGDGFSKPHASNWHLIRKSSDALYFLLKHFLLLARQDAAWTLPVAWETGTRRLADAFVRLWEQYGQFGQFVDVETGELCVGGSTSAAIAPAGLALASQYFGEEQYLTVAQAAASAMYEQFTQAGYTTGGPGEILQCPDSESAYGLLESFVVLYEVTGDAVWLSRASKMADQCASWCVSYDYAFPKNSLFGRLDMRSAGSVWANVQNKHSAPGICTLSGDALLKLYRATGNTRYLTLLRETAHNITQYLSRDDRRVGEMPAGWMNERVNLSDWAEPIGEIFHGSCWCEVSCMLTYAEVPGLYVQPDSGFVCAIDHIDAEVLAHDDAGITLRLCNPTAFPASVKVLIENATATATPLGQVALFGCPRVALPAGEAHEVRITHEGTLLNVESLAV